MAEYDFPMNKLANVQAQLEKLVGKNYYLHQAAKDAFRCGGGSREGVVRAWCHAWRAICCAHHPLGNVHQHRMTMCRGLIVVCANSLTIQPRRCLARRSYLLAYNSHHLKETFNVHSLDIKAVAQSFGFAQPPKVWCTGW